LKNENTCVDESIDLIEKVFQIGQLSPTHASSQIEKTYKINLS
jgi:glutamyl-tRNA reductase